MNILTIDFDVIMAPSIDIYRHWSDDYDWQNDPYLNLLRPDYQMYNYLTNYILQLCHCLNVEDIHIIEKHEQTINCCPKYQDFNLINIDHHHDIHYNQDNENEISELKLEQINEGNWIYYLYTNKEYQLNNYTWINNSNSEKYIGNTINYFTEENFYDAYAKQLPLNIDKLILCLSPGFSPTYIRPLFFLWLDVINQYYHVHINFEPDIKK